MEQPVDWKREAGEETNMTASPGKILAVLFVVAVLTSNVTGGIAPMVVLAGVAFALLCVSQGLHR